MTHLETIIELLDKMPNLCDDCISKELGSATTDGSGNP